MALTQAERIEACKVMSCDGPWQWRWRCLVGCEWVDCVGNPTWDWSNFIYRLKPQPRARYYNITEYDIRESGYATSEEAKRARDVPFTKTTKYVACIKAVEGQFDE